MIGGFKTELRGEVIIKGKGVMETYWLISQTNGNYLLNTDDIKNIDLNDSMLYKTFLKTQT